MAELTAQSELNMFQIGSDSLASRDADLELSRRLDWRFLLPNPRMRHLAYIGPDEGLLIHALQHFSMASLFISEPGLLIDHTASHSAFDLVVMHDSSQDHLRKAYSILRDGGYLYWEIGRTNLGQRWRLRHFREYISPLARMGFDDIRASWHRPDFDSCLEIIPLDEEVALRYVFTRHKGNLAGKIQVAAGKFLVKTDMLSRAVTCISLVARKTSSDRDLT